MKIGTCLKHVAKCKCQGTTHGINHLSEWTMLDESLHANYHFHIHLHDQRLTVIMQLKTFQVFVYLKLQYRCARPKRYAPQQFAIIQQKPAQNTPRKDGWEKAYLIASNVPNVHNFFPFDSIKITLFNFCLYLHLFSCRWIKVEQKSSFFFEEKLGELVERAKDWKIKSKQELERLKKSERWRACIHKVW